MSKLSSTSSRSAYGAKRLAKAVALADDDAELAAELRKRNQLIARLEGELLAAKRTSDQVVSLIGQIERINETANLGTVICGTPAEHVATRSPRREG
jgi:hypothetical protein